MVQKLRFSSKFLTFHQGAAWQHFENSALIFLFDIVYIYCIYVYFIIVQFLVMHFKIKEKFENPEISFAIQRSKDFNLAVITFAKLKTARFRNCYSSWSGARKAQWETTPPPPKPQQVTLRGRLSLVSVTQSVWRRINSHTVSKNKYIKNKRKGNKKLVSLFVCNLNAPNKTITVSKNYIPRLLLFV